MWMFFLPDDAEMRKRRRRRPARAEEAEVAWIRKNMNESERRWLKIKKIKGKDSKDGDKDGNRKTPSPHLSNKNRHSQTMRERRCRDRGSERDFHIFLLLNLISNILKPHIGFLYSFSRSAIYAHNPVLFLSSFQGRMEGGGVEGRGEERTSPIIISSFPLFI